MIRELLDQVPFLNPFNIVQMITHSEDVFITPFRLESPFGAHSIMGFPYQGAYREFLRNKQETRESE